MWANTYCRLQWMDAEKNRIKMLQILLCASDRLQYKSSVKYCNWFVKKKGAKSEHSKYQRMLLINAKHCTQEGKPKHCKYQRLQLMYSCKNRDMAAGWWLHIFCCHGLPMHLMLSNVFCLFRCACLAFWTLEIDILDIHVADVKLSLIKIVFKSVSY